MGNTNAISAHHQREGAPFLGFFSVPRHPQLRAILPEQVGLFEDAEDFDVSAFYAQESW